jgi:hypothetical protein
MAEPDGQHADETGGQRGWAGPSGARIAALLGEWLEWHETRVRLMEEWAEKGELPPGVTSGQ